MVQSENKLDKVKRVYLRISSNLPARIFLKGKLVKKVFINDLSATGVCFFMQGANLPGNSFELRFRLSFLTAPIKTQIVVRNSSPIQGGLRLGCSFEKITLADQKRINHYLCRHTDYRSWYKAVNIVSFFCLIDVFSRGFLWLALSYFEVVELKTPLVLVVVPRLEFVFYFFYAFFSLAAFLLSDPVWAKRGIKFLGFSLICFFPVIIFVAFKVTGYWDVGMLNSAYSGMRFFTGLYSLLLLFMTVTFISCLLSLHKASGNIKNEMAHRARI